jgi:hypothetical protein
MDRRRAARRTLSAGALVLLGAAAAGGAIPIREARWVAPNRLYQTLSSEPGECLAWPRDVAERRSVAIGRIAFRTPLLLGGQAARAGMSCATCHRNGRGNPDFLFRGLSGTAGTADVTSSLMSSHRGDHVVNPKPIPDLGGPRSLLKISRASDGKLESFIHGLVVEEFDGPEPSGDVLNGLAAYIRALRPEACRGGEQPIRLEERLAEVDAAVTLARQTDAETRRLMLAAARSSLGMVDERFQLPGLEGQRALLYRADRALEAIRSDNADFTSWDRIWAHLRSNLLQSERRSLFAKDRLRRLIDEEARMHAERPAS